MIHVLIGFGIYLNVCPVALLVYLCGWSRLLNSKDWAWSVIFLWPALPLWLVYAGAKWLLRRIMREQDPSS
jgi:hypothetical protein